MYLKPKTFPPGGFTTTKVNKEKGDGDNRLAMTNNRHAPNRYSKAYLIKDRIYKLSGSYTPLLASYHPLSITTNATP